MDKNYNTDYKNFSDIYDDLLNSELIDNEQKKTNLQNLFKGVVDYAFEIPTTIQSKSIKPIFEGKDLIAQSQSGTGKTGAFTIGYLTRIDPTKKYPQSIILATTRELASQIENVSKNISKYMDIKTCLTIGGETVNVEQNIKNSKNSHVIIGTPGRIKNIINENAFDISKINSFILDEADALLGGDFITQIKEIIIKLPKHTQICIFSATIDKSTLNLTKKFMKNPYIIKLEEENLSLDIISQYKVVIEREKFKIPTLLDLYKKLTINQAVIFTNTVKRAEYVYNFLKDEGYDVCLIHGKLTSVERIEILKNFRKQQFRVLITTDIIARGIDIQQITLVINYDMPQEKEIYLHRIGRSGRYGKLGVAINFIVSNIERGKRNMNNSLMTDNEKIESFSKNYNTVIKHLPKPDSLNNILVGNY